MFELGLEIQSLIKKACMQGQKSFKAYNRLCFGWRKKGESFDENGEIQNENYIYEIASILGSLRNRTGIEDICHSLYTPNEASII